MPNPPIMRYIINQVKLSTAPVPKADIVKIIEDIINIFFLPYLSLHAPAIRAPTKQPIRALLIAQPRSVAEPSMPKNGS